MHHIAFPCTIPGKTVSSVRIVPWEPSLSPKVNTCMLGGSTNETAKTEVPVYTTCGTRKIYFLILFKALDAEHML